MKRAALALLLMLAACAREHQPTKPPIIFIGLDGAD